MESKPVAIVTGGSRGLGKAIVDALHNHGMIVEAPVQSEVDVRDAEAVHAFVEGVMKKHGHIDVLINNAGAAESLAPLEKISVEDMDRVIDTNIKGVFHFLHAVLLVMKAQKSGVIINACSKAGSRAHPLLPVYSASKFAVRGITQAVARSCAEENLPIRCISLSPGGIDTDMRTELFGAENSHKQQKPEQVAQIVVDIINNTVDVPSGADVMVGNGKIEKVVAMDS